MLLDPCPDSPRVTRPPGPVCSLPSTELCAGGDALHRRLLLAHPWEAQTRDRWAGWSKAGVSIAPAPSLLGRGGRAPVPPSTAPAEGLSLADLSGSVHAPSPVPEDEG